MKQQRTFYKQLLDEEKETDELLTGIAENGRGLITR
jgi:hypothetical protein